MDIERVIHSDVRWIECVRAGPNRSLQPALLLVIFPQFAQCPGNRGRCNFGILLELSDPAEFGHRHPRISGDCHDAYPSLSLGIDRVNHIHQMIRSSGDGRHRNYRLVKAVARQRLFQMLRGAVQFNLCEWLS